ncbi:AAA family ATPase [Nocardioides immobilis]|uniref:AAA family ATPase n=1 Tax=Nocardioides immobilis TaxID=2049295 RepID=A0A417Y5S6_9ACTN|nr:AAA family ATPase [Nocardioides immobilis]RHW27945.1 AAA family ATPase [Nocardioides immobilis]
MSDSLADCLNALVAAARAAGIDEATARAEGEALAATVAERSKGAFVDWCEQTGRPGATEDFFVAAKQGNRFRAGPTPAMSQLALGKSEHAPSYARALGEVALAATLLGQPGPEAVGTASMATAAQLGEARTLTPSSTGPGAFDLPGRQPVPGVGDEMLDQVRRMGDQVRRQLEAINVGTGSLLPDAPVSDTSGIERTPPVADAARVSDEARSAREGETRAESAGPQETVAAVEPEEPTKTVEELLAELDAMIGLDNVKGEIHRQAAVLRVEGLRKKAGLESPTITRHLVFNGNPGTGKTTVARLVAGIYRALGLLSKGQLVEVDRSELVAGYLGQTAQKTADVVKSAEGGVLFIDEAYSLSGDQYGKEAIDTLVKEMEDKRDDLVVIVAGYPLPMAIFISENPGLESRFRTMIEFANYTDDELVAIFEQMATGADYDAGEDVVARLREILADAPRGPSFGNARYVRNMLEAAIGHHAWRLRDVKEPTLEQLRSLEADDLAIPDDGEPDEPVVAEDGTLLPPADAEPADVVDALEPGDEGAEPTVETVPADPVQQSADEGQEES